MLKDTQYKESQQIYMIPLSYFKYHLNIKMFSNLVIATAECMVATPSQDVAEDDSDMTASFGKAEVDCLDLPVQNEQDTLTGSTVGRTLQADLLPLGYNQKYSFY